MAGLKRPRGTVGAQQYKTQWADFSSAQGSAFHESEVRRAAAYSKEVPVLAGNCDQKGAPSEGKH